MYLRYTLTGPLFYCQISLVKGRGKKEEDISIIPQVPVASLVFLPYYKYVLVAGHISSEIEVRLYSQPQRKEKKNQLDHLAKTKIANIQLKH